MNTPASPQGSSPSTLSERVQSLRLPEAGGKTSPRTSIFPWVLCGVLALTTAFFGVKSMGGPASDEVKEEDLEAALAAKLDPSKAPKGKDGSAMPSSSRTQE